MRNGRRRKNRSFKCLLLIKIKHISENLRGRQVLRLYINLIPTEQFGSASGDYPMIGPAVMGLYNRSGRQKDESSEEN